MFELMWPWVQAAQGELILDTVSKTGESWQLSSTSSKDERRAPCEPVITGAHCVAEEQAAPEQDRHLGTRLVRQRHRAQQCWAMYACRLSPALAECKRAAQRGRWQATCSCAPAYVAHRFQMPHHVVRQTAYTTNPSIRDRSEPLEATPLWPWRSTPQQDWPGHAIC